MSPDLSKKELRQRARARRAALAAAQPDLPLELSMYAEDLDIEPGTVVGAYHAHRDEADPAQLAARLVELGAFIAFPRVAGNDAALAFHHVPDGEVLVPGGFGIHEPLAHWPAVTPRLLLVPLLAFDRKGHRLGYGGGHYDRTLAALRVPAFGIAYAGQEVPSLPSEAHDMALDGIITEEGLRRFR